MHICICMESLSTVSHHVSLYNTFIACPHIQLCFSRFASSASQVKRADALLGCCFNQEGRGGGGRGPGLGARKEGGRGSLREGEAGDLSAEANLGHRRHFQHALLMVLRVLNS